jgi:hypothetical protein
MAIVGIDRLLMAATECTRATALGMELSAA